MSEIDRTVETQIARILDGISELPAEQQDRLSDETHGLQSLLAKRVHVADQMEAHLRSIRETIYAETKDKAKAEANWIRLRDALLRYINS